MGVDKLRPSHVVIEEGGKYEFSGEQMPPVGPDKLADLDITKIGPDLNPYDIDIDSADGPAPGHDTYTGIPGDGIVPG